MFTFSKKPTRPSDDNGVWGLIAPTGLEMVELRQLTDIRSSVGQSGQSGQSVSRSRRAIVEGVTSDTSG
jgi:hypothetical protein